MSKKKPICPVCRGTKVCQECGGTGKNLTSGSGLCWRCSGARACQYCYGQGEF